MSSVFPVSLIGQNTVPCLIYQATSNPTLKTSTFVFMMHLKSVRKPHKYERMHTCLQNFGAQESNLHFHLFAPSKHSICFISDGPFDVKCKEDLPSQSSGCIFQICTFSVVKNIAELTDFPRYCICLLLLT